MDSFETPDHDVRYGLTALGHEALGGPSATHHDRVPVPLTSAMPLLRIRRTRTRVRALARAARRRA